MPMTEPERHELYELAKHHVNDRFADLMISALPPDPSRLAGKDDVAARGSDLRTEMAELRGSLRREMAELSGSLRREMAELSGSLRREMAELSGSLRQEMAELRVEMRDLTSQQTRTLMIGLVLSITALAITQLVIAAMG